VFNSKGETTREELRLKIVWVRGGTPELAVFYFPLLSERMGDWQIGRWHGMQGVTGRTGLSRPPVQGFQGEEPKRRVAPIQKLM
jgi:hypothetical protein